MIKFFRRIRRKLLDEGNLKGYVVYAFGEILLVVIGILIALQINNWNEERKNKIKEIEYLKALQKEFHLNLFELERDIKGLKRIRGNIKEAIKYTGPVDVEINNMELSKLIRAVFAENTEYEPQIGVVEGIINSGNLNRISNEELRSNLAGWNAWLSIIRKHETVIEEYRSVIKEILIKKGNMINIMVNGGDMERHNFDIGPHQFDTDNRNILRNPEFENNLVFRFFASTALEYRYNELKSEIETILECINKELK